MAAMQDKYRGSKEYLLVYAELITAARYRGTFTYQEVAKIMGLPLMGSHMGRETGVLLGEISEDEHNHGRPLLSAVAVNVNGLATGGFFSQAKYLGRLQEESEEGKRQFWEKEKAAVYEAWKKDLGG